MLKRIFFGVLLVVVAFAGVCYAEGYRQWVCPHCSTTITYDTPVERPSDKDIQAAGPCYDIGGHRRTHHWMPVR